LLDELVVTLKLIARTGGGADLGQLEKQARAAIDFTHPEFFELCDQQALLVCLAVFLLCDKALLKFYQAHLHMDQLLAKILKESLKFVQKEAERNLFLAALAEQHEEPLDEWVQREQLLADSLELGLVNFLCMFVAEQDVLGKRIERASDRVLPLRRVQNGLIIFHQFLKLLVESLERTLQLDAGA